MTPQDQAASLTLEVGIVWLEPPENHPYAREDFYPCDSPDGPTHYGGCLQDLGKPGEPGTRRLVGWATLSPDAPPIPHYAPPHWARRIFYVKEYDRSNKPDGIYKDDKPWEGVDPLTVAPGVYGKHNDRAWGCTTEQAETSAEAREETL